MRGSRKFCQRGSNLDNVFLVRWGRTYPNTTISGPFSARQRNASLACRLWPKNESWLGSFFKGIGTSIAKIFEGVRTPCPLWIRTCTTSSYELNRANVLLIFQCPGKCLTPSQVVILVSDDSLAFCPTTCMYNRVFTCVETRAKSELRVRLVPLNMLKLSSFSFSCRRFLRSSF